MMRSNLTFACVAILATSAATAAPPASNCSDQFNASPINVRYDPLGDQARNYVVVPVTLTGTAYGDTQLHAEFADQELTSPVRIGTHGPIYDLQRSGTVVKPGTGIFDPGFAFHYTFNNNGIAEPISGIQLLIDPGQDVAAGVYGESLDMVYRCQDPQSIYTQSAVLQITVDVPSSLTASLAGGSASGTLDFADFSSLSRSVQVNVYATGPYALSVVSLNAQKMKLADAPAGAAGNANAEIGYTITFNGAAVSTAASAHFARTGVLGAHLPLAVTAESVAGKRAGAYHDTLTLTFTPLATL